MVAFVLMLASGAFGDLAAENTASGFWFGMLAIACAYTGGVIVGKRQ